MPNPYEADYPRSKRPSTERAEMLGGVAFFCGAVAMVFAAMLWGAIATWVAAAALATISGLGAIILFAVGYAQARRAGYQQRRREEWDERHGQPR